MTAREEVLGRVRAAIGDTQPVLVERHYWTAGAHPAGSRQLVGLLVDRLGDYRATVLTCGPDDDQIAAAITAEMRRRRVEQLLAPAGVPARWVQHVQPLADDPGLTPQQLDSVAGVLTGCRLAVAETGTLVLDNSALCGRRIVTLIPDLHVCVVRSSQIVHSVVDGIRGIDPNGPLTFISGPSATSDIELERVEGVHGPRQLVVIIAREP